MTRIKAQFTERPTRFVGTDDRQGWRLKRYEITLTGVEVASEIRAGAEATVDRHLAAVAIEPSVGFVVMHAGEDAIWLLINLWNHELLHQVTLSASLDTPDVFAPVDADGPSACVWELRVIAHEREAYVRHVLHAPTDPARYDTYLSDSSGEHIPGADANGRCNHRAVIEAFNARWSDGDVDGLMKLLTENPVYRASTGPGPGEAHHGQAEVRAAFERVMATESALGASPPDKPLILIDGNQGISSWAYRGRDHLGNPSLIEGVDLWVFEQGRIALKDAYRKAFPDVPTGTVAQGEFL
tara:strand:- start:2783 stop:3676 length:894 start_codon:yes stop_codon:yes gene_type:complete